MQFIVYLYLLSAFLGGFVLGIGFMLGLAFIDQKKGDRI
jgi:formate/nitrite transporter FocA (FNT family)